MKKNIISLSFFSLLIVCGIFYLLTEFISKDKAKDLENSAVEKARAVVKATLPHFNRALESSDDINLLINVESVAKVENIIACFILDKNNKVIVRNNTNEWNRGKISKIYNRATNQKTELFQKTQDNNFLLFSEPLMNNCTLFCIFSVQKTKETARFWKIKYYAVASFAALLITVVLYFLSKLLILLPFNRIKKSLELNSLYDVKGDKYNKISDITTTEREKIAKKIELLEEDRKSLRKIIEYSYKTSTGDNPVFIILNSLNIVIYAYDRTGKILKNDFEKDRHILEISKNTALVETVAKANENPGKEINKSFDNYTITAVSINANGKTAGTIIKMK